MSDYAERMAAAKKAEAELGMDKPDPLETACRTTNNYLYHRMLDREKGQSGGNQDMNTPDAGTGLCADAPRDIGMITEEVRFYKAQAGKAFLEIGKCLNEAKAQLPHGDWLPWLHEKVDISERSAQVFMRLAKEYGKSAEIADLGASKALQLLALNPTDRESFVEEKHIVGGTEKSVEEMTSKELKKAIRERDEALAAKKEAEKNLDNMTDDLSDAQRERDEATKAKQEAERTLQEQTDKQQQAAAKLKAEREKVKNAKAAAESAKKELEELKAKPVDVAVQQPDKKTLDKFRAEAEAAAEEKVKKANAALEEAQGKAAAAEAEAEKARKQMELSGREITIFQLLFNDWQRSYVAMADALKKVTDKEKTEKLRRAVRAAAEKMGGGCK